VITEVPANRIGALSAAVSGTAKHALKRLGYFSLSIASIFLPI